VKTITFALLFLFILSACGPAPTPTVTPIPPTATVPPVAIGPTQVSPVDGMVQVDVPAGEFLMGSPGSNVLANNDEKPQHSVYLDAYWIDQTEVTNAMYARCVNAGACQPPASTQSKAREKYYGDSTYDDYPVIYVSWNDAKAYCGWAGRRLPTEAEWEKAARGTDGRVYPWGNQYPSLTLANYKSVESNQVDTSEVGHYPAGASPYGALDMAGNVWEWVNDWYGANYYTLSPASNPPGPATGTERVLRGSSWEAGDWALRTVNRSHSELVSSLEGVGFRCAATPGK
jgi:formylglycine-generating enzyme required for sulfatase activity